MSQIRLYRTKTAAKLFRVCESSKWIPELSLVITFSKTIFTRGKFILFCYQTLINKYYAKIFFVFFFFFLGTKDKKAKREHENYTRKTLNRINWLAYFTTAIDSLKHAITFYRKFLRFHILKEEKKGRKTAIIWNFPANRKVENGKTLSNNLKLLLG